MSVRQAHLGDAISIAEIANGIIRDTLVTFTTDEQTPDSVADEIAARGARFLVAEREGAVVGFATYGPFRSGPGYACTREHSIQLSPQSRGRGLGRALMAELEEVARRDKVHVLVAGVSGANPGGIAFHTTIGFQQVGLMPQVGRKAGQWLDLVLMQKIIAKE